MSKSGFFSGLEEVLARFIAVFITLLFFVVYIIASGNYLEIDWIKFVLYAGIFWLMYELVALILFSMFSFFARMKPPEEVSMVVASTPIPETTHTEITTTKTDAETNIDNEIVE